MTDWTVILTAVGAAAVTGFFGYAAARRSSLTTIRQVEAENERLRMQHREDHLRNRQTTYHLLMTAEQELAYALGLGIGDGRQAFANFRNLGNGAVLFGTDPVKNAVTNLLAQYVGVMREAQELAGGPGENISGDDIKVAFNEHLERLGKAQSAMVEAMRDDVGPS